MKTDELVATARAVLAELESASGVPAVRARAKRLMELFFELGLELSRDPEAEFSEGVQDFLVDTAQSISRCATQLRVYMADTLQLAERPFEGDEWLELCERRSGIETLRRLYSGTSGDVSTELASDALDAQLRARGADEGPARKVPDGMPAEHWWWWYPG
jgi:hypothetical protein